MYAAAAALEQDPSNPLSVQDYPVRQINWWTLGKRMPEGCPQSIRDPATDWIGAAGILRYKRESDNQKIDLTTIHPESQRLTENPVKCQFCGRKIQPLLGLPLVQRPEEALLFCCAQWQQLYEILKKNRCLVGGRCDLRPGTPPSVGDKPATEREELLILGREVEDPNRFPLNLPSGLGEQSEVGVYESDSVQLPVVETFVPASKVLNFRLSGIPGKGCWALYPGLVAEQRFEMNAREEVVSVPICGCRPLQFGTCHHLQDRSEVLQKNYSSGVRFLTVFPDGSAQVFYPSGLLAVIVTVTEGNGRVCLVYDDSDAPHRPVRAIFQSDGRATCYHSNKGIWLSLNRAGGQCLDKEGTRVRRWSWGGLTPTLLRPVFLSLNKSVGVRVLGREQIFVSFLARGQQVKFSVGTCCTQGECVTVGDASGPPALKEELFVQAARVRIHLAFQHLHLPLKNPSCPRAAKTTRESHLHDVSQRPLAPTAAGMMS